MRDICYITDILPGETDILTPIKNGTLELTAEDGRTLQRTPAPPVAGWSHEVLMERYSKVDFLGVVDAYISDVWVGSTEV